MSEFGGWRKHQYNPACTASGKHLQNAEAGHYTILDASSSNIPTKSFKSIQHHNATEAWNHSAARRSTFPKFRVPVNTLLPRSYPHPSKQCTVLLLPKPYPHTSKQFTGQTVPVHWAKCTILVGILLLPRSYPHTDKQFTRQAVQFW